MVQWVAVLAAQAPAARKRAMSTPSDETVVQTAADAAEQVIFTQYKQSRVKDFDVTVTFEEGVLEVDVYLNAPTDGPDPDAVADEAALAGQQAVDELFN